MPVKFKQSSVFHGFMWWTEVINRSWTTTRSWTSCVVWQIWHIRNTQSESDRGRLSLQFLDEPVNGGRMNELWYMCVSVRCRVGWFSRGCSHLEFVNISWCCLVTDDGVRHLVAKCTNIQYFLCKGCVKVMLLLLLHFPWVIDDAKCTLVTCVCVPVHRRIPTLLHRAGCNVREW